jgi:hypothetical protein
MTSRKERTRGEHGEDFLGLSEAPYGDLRVLLEFIRVRNRACEIAGVACKESEPEVPHAVEADVPLQRSERHETVLCDTDPNRKE